jgi:hypothetical protein
MFLMLKGLDKSLEEETETLGSKDERHLGDREGGHEDYGKGCDCAEEEKERQREE